jgi:hypothetical protein
MLSLVVSTIAFFVARIFIIRKFDEMDLPKGMTRSVMVFCLAVAIAYAVAAAIDWVAGHA